MWHHLLTHVSYDVGGLYSSSGVFGMKSLFFLSAL